MNINLLRLKPVVKELHQLRIELSRIADCLEADLADRNINITTPKRIPTSDEPPELFLTDEEEDFVWELEESSKPVRGKGQEDAD